MYICVCMYIYVHTYIYIYIYVCVCVSVCMFIYLYICIHIYICTYICMYKYMSSSCRAASMDLPDSLLPPISFVHPSPATSCIGTELLYIGSSWSSNLCLSTRKGSHEYIFMSSSLLLQQCSACLVCLALIVFHDGWLVAIQLLFCGVLPPGLFQYC